MDFSRPSLYTSSQPFFLRAPLASHSSDDFASPSQSSDVHFNAFSTAATAAAAAAVPGTASEQFIAHTEPLDPSSFQPTADFDAIAATAAQFDSEAPLLHHHQQQQQQQQQQQHHHHHLLLHQSGYDSSSPPNLQQQQQQQQQQLQASGASDINVVTNPLAVDGTGLGIDMSIIKNNDLADDLYGKLLSEEEDGVAPASTRRKAQNRAAQRAFRERKERRVKDLEAQVVSLVAAQQVTATENEKLKRDLHKVSTENEVLRATTLPHTVSISPMPTHTGPLHYKPTDFYSSLHATHRNKIPSHRIATSDKGEKLLAAGAAWEYIINHDLFRKGLVDIQEVSDRLKGRAKCDGQGPVFAEDDVLFAINNSVASGCDALL